MTASRTSFTLAVCTTAVVAATAGYLAGTARRQAGLPPPILAHAPSSRPPGARNLDPEAAPGAAVQGDRLPWDRQWQRVSGLPRTPRSERELTRLLGELAATDHARALQMALAEPNLKTRLAFRNAVLHGWAEVDAPSAEEYALALHEDERSAALTEIFAGAASQPAIVAKLAATACDRDPARAFDYAQALITTLGDGGDFPAVAQFIAGRPASPQRLEEADNAFTSWAEHRPAEAAAAVSSIDDPELRAAALRGMIVGWSHADPAALADYALGLPAGESRSLAMANAVPRWVERDPVAAATWLAQREPHPDFDLGVAAVATFPSMVAQKPQLAISLAQSITDAPLRTNTLQTLVLQWGQADAVAAARYVETAPNLSDAERAVLLSAIKEHHS